MANKRDSMHSSPKWRQFLPTGAVWRVFKYLKYYPWHIASNFFFNTLAVFFNLFTFVMIVPFIDLLFSTIPPQPTLPPFELSQSWISAFVTFQLASLEGRYGLWRCLVGVAVIYLVFSFLSNLCRYLAQFFISPMRNGVTMRLRNDLYHHITILPVSYFNARRRGDILSRMSNDIADIEWGVLTSVIALGKEPINIIVFSVALIFISPRLFLYFLIVLPLSLWLIGRIGDSLRRNSAKAQSQLGSLFSVIEETLGAIRTVKGLGQEDARQRLFRRTNEQHTRTSIRVALRRELGSPLSEILITLGLVFILILGGMAVLHGEIPSSLFILFVILFARLIPPVQALIRAYNNLQKADAAAARIFEVLDADERIKQKADALVMPSFKECIEYRNVSFSYQDSDNRQQPTDCSLPDDGPQTHMVLRHINLTIPKGANIAIVGPSGAGKSTFADLLPRFYDPTQGQILIDGIPITDLDINSLRRQIGLVSQHCILFNDTVANNIAFGCPDYSLDKVVEAARIAHADEFIDQLPQGYQTPIGDSGLTLSGGQRQRLSIARAVLKDPPILILDEATSALDTESEQYVQQALQEATKGRTVITIAHRLSTIAKADSIVVFDHGVIVEQGTHQELLAAGGAYGRLLQLSEL